MLLPMFPFVLSLVLLQAAGPTSLQAERDRLESVLAANPKDTAAQEGEVRVSEQLALSARAAGDLNGALSDLLRAQQLVPENARLLYDTAVLEEQIGLYHDAADVVDHLRKIAPNDEKVLYLASHVELDLGRLADAETDMRAYLKIHPDDASAIYGLGRILQQAQQSQAARAQFERSIAIKPLQTESYYQLGQLDLDAGDFEAAIREDNKVVARNPAHAGAVTAIGIALFRLKRYPEAEAQLKHAIEVDPNYQPGHYFYGLVLARTGKKEDSTRELAIAAKLAEEANRKDAQRLRLNPSAPGVGGAPPPPGAY